VSRRTERISGELLAVLAQLVREEVTDPRVGLVTLTRADVAPDLSNALVFWSAIDLEAGDSAERLEEIQDGLESAASFLRKRAADRLPLRRMPALRFRYDPSMALGSRTLSVLRDVAPAEADPEATAGPDAEADPEERGDGEEE